MAYYVGRFLQLLGLVALPVGVLLSLQRDSLQPELLYLGMGGLLFVVGWMLTRSFGSKE